MRNRYFSNLFALLVMLSFSLRAFAAEAPFIAPIANQVATIGELFTYDVDALYADPPETYELLLARPGMVINPSNGMISWTPADPSHGGKVTVKASNSEGASERSFFVYLSDGIVCEEDLISYWNLDETSGDTFADFAGGYTASSLSPLIDTEGQVDRAKEFAPLGRADEFAYVTDVHQYDFNRADGFSISMWFKYNGQHTGIETNQVLIARGDYFDNPAIWMCLMIDVEHYANPRMSFSLRPRYNDAPTKEINIATTVTTGAWHHVAVVYDGAASGDIEIRFYLDGVRPLPFTHYWSVGCQFKSDDAEPYDLTAGYWADYIPSLTYPFNGEMDEILIYKKALSDAEVQQIRNDGLAGKPNCRPGNYFPLITSDPVTTAYEDSLYTYTFIGDDYEGEPLAYSAVDIPAWLTFNPETGVLSGTPSNDDVGPHTVELSATDGTTEVTQEFTVTVINVNDPPEFTSTPKTTAKEGVVYTDVATATDPDGDDLEFWAEIIPGWLTFDTETQVLAGIPGREDVGDNQVKLIVSDGMADAEQEFIIIVDSDNNSPVVTSTPPAAVDNYSEYYYQMTAYDPDGDELNYSAVNVPYWLTFDAVTQELSGTPTKINVGDHAVSLVVSDGYSDTPHDFTITVRDVNTAPQVVGEDPKDTATVGVLYTYFVQAVDYDNDDLTLVGVNIPLWMNFDENTGVLSGIPAQTDIGPHTVLITISDGALITPFQFIITVVSGGTGIEPVEDMVSGIYPNPARDYVVFEFTKEVSRVEISDLAGKILISKIVEKGRNRVQIDVTGLNNGMYIFRVFDKADYQTGKLIIN